VGIIDLVILLDRIGSGLDSEVALAAGGFIGL